MARMTSRLRPAALLAVVVLCAALAHVPGGEAFSFGGAASSLAARRRPPIGSGLSAAPRGKTVHQRRQHIILRLSDAASDKEPDATKKAEESDYRKITSLDEYASKIQENVLGGGEFGSRGEVYVILQFVILLCIGLGGIPFIGEAIASIVGPGLILGGLAFVYLAAIQMGTALSPWPAPVRAESEGGRIRRDGVFGSVRHPIYAGLLMGMAGLSVVTDSASRLLLTAALAFVMNLKAEFEEERMKEAFPSGEYEEYMEEVGGRFLPEELVAKVTDFVKKIVE